MWLFLLVRSLDIELLFFFFFIHISVVNKLFIFVMYYKPKEIFSITEWVLEEIDVSPIIYNIKCFLVVWAYHIKRFVCALLFRQACSTLPLHLEYFCYCSLWPSSYSLTYLKSEWTIYSIHSDRLFVSHFAGVCNISDKFIPTDFLELCVDHLFLLVENSA